MADYRDFGGEGHYVSCTGPWACSCDVIRERSQRDAPSPPAASDPPGHCAGPSWAAHEVTEVYEGDACPSCGMVML